MVPEVRKLEESERQMRDAANRALKSKDELVEPLTKKVGTLTAELKLAEDQRKKAQEGQVASVKELNVVEAVLQRALSALGKAKVAFDADKVREEIRKETNCRASRA
jgi:hypothetical protein